MERAALRVEIALDFKNCPSIRYIVVNKRFFVKLSEFTLNASARAALNSRSVLPSASWKCGCVASDDGGMPRAFSIACPVTSSRARRAMPSAIAMWNGWTIAGRPSRRAGRPVTAFPRRASINENVMSSGTNAPSTRSQSCRTSAVPQRSSCHGLRSAHEERRRCGSPSAEVHPGGTHRSRPTRRGGSRFRTTTATSRGSRHRRVRLFLSA